jgi:hypothetical protein
VGSVPCGFSPVGFNSVGSIPFGFNANGTISNIYLTLGSRKIGKIFDLIKNLNFSNNNKKSD